MSKALWFSLLVSMVTPSVIEARDCKPVHPARLYASGTEYSLDLGDVSGAQQVRIEESRSSFFSTSKTFTYNPATSAPPRFQHVSIRNEQLFYRVTLFNDADPAFVPCTWTDLITIEQGPGVRALVRRSYVPVVGSAAGANGARFRTSMTMINPDAETMHGRIIFRAQDVPGSSSDPAIPFALAPNERRELADIVAAFGRTGLGSLDIVLDDDAPDWLPLVQTRAFNEAADGATFGIAVPQVPALKLGEGGIATYVVPDPAKSLLNIGVRTWGSGGEAEFILQRADGTGVSVKKQFAGDYFQQMPAKDWIGADLAQGDTIYVVSLGAIVYGTLTDNRSNDPTMLIRFGELEVWQRYVGEFFF